MKQRLAINASDFAIAPPYALRQLRRCLERLKPKTVLEVGAGLGTATAVLVDTLSALHGRKGYRLVSIEPNAWLRPTLRSRFKRDNVLIVSRYEKIPREIPPFDFLFLDGGGPYWQDKPDPASPVVEQNCLYVSDLAPQAGIFVENDRAAQRALITTVLDRKWVHHHYLPLIGGSTGYHFYQLDPDPETQRRFARLNALRIPMRLLWWIHLVLAISPSIALRRPLQGFN